MNKTEVVEKKRSVFRLVLDFLGTGKSFENKERFYLILGVTTLGLAALFGAILIVGAVYTVFTR
ncbi:MAG: hypothetical protein ACYC1U_11005 [Candidatus Aquicultorales bacterium]